MGVKWTKQQQKVIDLRNRNILVSAAAGSGKTAVLVERITSGEAGYVSSQCADHDDTQFLSVCDKGTFSCDRS